MLSSEDTALSSPAPPDNAIFSDEPTHASSPPSSPPGFPWELDQPSGASHTQPSIPSPPTLTAFSVLGKRKALNTVSDNARPAKKKATHHTSIASAAEKKKKPLTQMQISVGQRVQMRCKGCGMEYVASSAEDRKLHDKYHKQNTEGYVVGKHFAQQLSRDGTVFPGTQEGDFISWVDCFDLPGRKKKAQAVLEIVQRQLGAVPIDEREIWNGPDAAGRSESHESKYRAYLHVRGDTCIGFLLLETITEARRVLEPTAAGTTSSRAAEGKSMSALAALRARQRAAEKVLEEAATDHPIRLSVKSHPCRLGISRIWTSPTHRHQDVAITLLDTVLLHYEQLVKNQLVAEKRASRTPRSAADAAVERLTSRPERSKVGKDDVAFSQPTSAGARLARRWFGKAYGWSVYVD